MSLRQLFTEIEQDEWVNIPWLAPDAPFMGVWSQG